MARRELTPAQLRLVGAVKAELTGEQPVVLAVSGGADSLAMAAAMAWLIDSRRRSGQPLPQVSAAVVDHQLQSGSDQVAIRARTQLQGLGLAAVVLTAPGATGTTPAGPEATARELRLRLLDERARAMIDPSWGREQAAEVWLAHTRDDVAEQVLLGLARGSGARSLSGIPPRSELVIAPQRRPLSLVRPLLRLPRADTAQACADWQLSPWQDPHNGDLSFTRSRVRQRVLPMLEDELGPGIAAALARSADLLRADADLLDELTGQWLDQALAGDDLLIEAVLDHPEARVSRVVRAWLVARGARQPSLSQVEAVRRLLGHTGLGGVDLVGGRVHRLGGRLRFEPAR